MTAKCEKNGCGKEAVKTLRFVDQVHTSVDTDDPVVLCEGHANEVDRFPKTDVAAVKEWLNG
jgi:hypothetical protein